jgi:acyl-CoA synthetase (AMP-forming)/AMP-acid ligase II
MLDHFDPASWAADAARLGATLTSLFAVHARRVLAEAPSSPSPSLRAFLFSQHLTEDERAEVEARYGAPAVQLYGLTETIAPTIADSLYGPRRSDTVGAVVPWASVKLVDHGGRTVAPGKPGELMVSGEPGRSLMAGYFKRPDETALVLRDGWLRTGDRMVQEPDGTFRFLGRAAEVIKPGVDNVSAPEVERVLYEHVSVLDASVVGARNDAGDEEIVAFVVLHPGDDATPEELLAWCAERLADYKVPQRVIVVDELPRNQIGKVLRRELQRRLS